MTEQDAKMGEPGKKTCVKSDSFPEAEQEENITSIDVYVLKLREEIEKGKEYALVLTVKTPEDARLATNELITIGNLKKNLEAKRKEFVGPHQTYIKVVNDIFKTMSEPLLEADKAIQRKIIDYKTEMERIRKAAEDAALKQIEANEAARKVMGRNRRDYRWSY